MNGESPFRKHDRTIWETSIVAETRRETSGRTLGLIGVVIFAPTSPLTRIAVAKLSPAF